MQAGIRPAAIDDLSVQEHIIPARACYVIPAFAGMTGISLGYWIVGQWIPACVGMTRMAINGFLAAGMAGYYCREREWQPEYFIRPLILC